MKQFAGSTIVGATRNARATTRAGTIGGHEAGRQVANAQTRDRTVERLSAAGGLLGMVYMFDLLKAPSMLMRKMGLVKRTGTLRSLAYLPGVMEMTPLSDLAKLPSVVVENASQQYRAVGSVSPADKLAAKAGRIDQRMLGVGETLERGYAPVRRSIHGVIDRVAAGQETGAVGRLGSRFASWRVNANIRRAQGAYENIASTLGINKPPKAEEIIKIFPKANEDAIHQMLELAKADSSELVKQYRDQGRLSELANFRVQDSKPNSLESYFSDLTKRLAKAQSSELANKHTDLSRLTELAKRDVKGLGHAALESHYSEIAHEAKSLLGKGGLHINASNAVMDVARSAKQSVQAMGAAISHAAAKEQGLAAILKNIKLSRMPVLMAVVGLGAAATTGAAMLTAKNENKAGDQVLKDMAEMLGGKNHPYLANVGKQHRSQHARRWASTGLTAVGEGMFVGTVGTANMGMSMMLAQGALPMLGQVLVKDEPVLNAFANLQQAEKGTLQMPQADAVAQVRQLVGAVPSVQPHGGYYNKLCQPIAAKIVADKLSLRETMQLLGDPAKFNAYAKDVKNTQARVPHGIEALKTKGLDSVDHTHPQAEDFQEQADFKDKAEREQAARELRHSSHQNLPSANDNLQAANDQGPMIDAPGLKVQANEAEHDGILAEQQRAVGQNS